jgi:hypothetical protein
MKRLVLVALLLAGLPVEPTSVQSLTAPANSVPQVIYWPRSPNQPLNPVGLLYTPELLGEKARNASAPVSARIREAISKQTPIVVMWTIPGPQPESIQRLFSTVIVEDGPGGGDSWSPRRIEPLWVQQDAEDLRQIDPETPFKTVGVMAAFPRSAFVAGRLITIYTSLPCYPDRPCEPGHRKGVQVFGRIEWSGGAAVSSASAR